MVVCRTAISELAKGDKELEAKGVGILMSMVGYGMLISPSLGGLLSEPLRQYPNWEVGDEQIEWILTMYPFLIPNLIAALLAFLSTAAVLLCVEETLPMEKRREWTSVPADMALTVRQWLAGIFKSSAEIQPTPRRRQSSIQSVGWENDLKILDSKEFVATATLMATRQSRASFVSALSRTSTTSQQTTGPVTDTEKQVASEQTPLIPSTKDKNKESPKHVEESEQDSVSMASLWNKPTVKAYMVAYWANSFSNVCQGEAFPLFAMATVGGLGLEEKLIGTVGTLAGLMYCIGQYLVFTFVMKNYGLVGALRWGAFWGAVPVVGIPLSLFLTGWLQIAYLAFVTGIIMICNSVFLGCSTIGANRSVEPFERATMNGMSSIGTSIGRGLGPICAGLLVAALMTSPILPASLGGWCLYGLLGVIGVASYLTTLKISKGED